MIQLNVAEALGGYIWHATWSWFDVPKPRSWIWLTDRHFLPQGREDSKLWSQIVLFFVNNFHDICFSHVGRSGNQAAHNLAKLALVSSDNVWIEEVPPSISSCILIDMFPVAFLIYEVFLHKKKNLWLWEFVVNLSIIYNFSFVLLTLKNALQTSW